MDKGWENIQKKTFTKWCNSHLVKKSFPPLENLTEDFDTGINLMNLVNALYDVPIPKHNKAPKMRPHKLDNIEMALKMLESPPDAGAGVKTNFLGTGHLIDHDQKMLLGMIWAIILDFQIKGISVEEMTAKEGLLLWCKRKTAGYQDVKVENFTTSFQDGLAFCALIHRHRPDLLDFDKLSKSNPRENLELAFDVAEKQLGIPRLLDVEDIVDVPRPDERSVVTYVSEYFHKFSAQDQVEVAGRRIANLVALAKANDQLKADYEAQAQALVDWINAKNSELQDHEYDQTLSGIEGKWDEFKNYKKSEKPTKTKEKLSVESSLHSLQTKLKLNKRKPYSPPDHLKPEAIDNLWQGLGGTENQRSDWIRQEIQRQQRIENLADKFWRKAKALEQWGTDTKEALSSTEYGETVAAVQAKLKNHEGFEDNHRHTASRLEATKALGNELLSERYGNGDAVQQKMTELDAMYAEVKDHSDKRRAALEQQLARQQSLEELRLKFAADVRNLTTWIDDAEDGEIAEAVKASSVQAAQASLDSFANFNNELAGATEKFNALVALDQQCASEGITENPYAPFSMDAVQARWARLNSAVEERKATLDSEMERQQQNEQFCKTFAEKAQAFADVCDERKAELAVELTGELQAQYDAAGARIAKIESHRPQLDEVAEASRAVDERGIAFNPFSEQTIENLTLLFNELGEAATKQQAVIQKAILAQSGSGVSDEQLAEFKETFDTFDKDKSGTLEKHELKACMSALGHDMSEEKLDNVMNTLGQQQEEKIVLLFENFVEYMTKLVSNSDSPDTIKNAFKAVAQDKDFVTEEDLRRVPGMQSEDIDYLLNEMGNGNMDYSNFVDSQYA